MGQVTSNWTCVAAFEDLLGYCLSSELTRGRDGIGKLYEPCLLQARWTAQANLVSDNDTPNSDCSWRRHYLDCGIGCLSDR
jgi:hypothetical protein